MKNPICTYNNHYQKCFKNPNGRTFGDWVSTRFLHLVFNGINEQKNSHHDAIWHDNRIEVKSIRATHYGYGQTDPDAKLENQYEQRALYSTKTNFVYGQDCSGIRRKLSNISFQQTKSLEFDIFIGFVFFLDLVKTYIVPSSHIAKNVYEKIARITITTQHRNYLEGHMTLEKIPNYMMFELDMPLLEISPRNLGNYIL